MREKNDYLRSIVGSTQKNNIVEYFKRCYEDLNSDIDDLEGINLYKVQGKRQLLRHLIKQFSVNPKVFNDG